MKINIAIISSNETNSMECQAAWELFYQTQTRAFLPHVDVDLRQFDVICLPKYIHSDDLSSETISSHRLADNLKQVVEDGKLVLGIGGGFRFLTELGILYGAFNQSMAEKSANCRLAQFQLLNNDSPFARNYYQGFVPRFHSVDYHGDYSCSTEVEAKLIAEDLIQYRFVDNNSDNSGTIAGILNPQKNVLGVLAHPERSLHYWQGSSDGFLFFHSIIRSLLN